MRYLIEIRIDDAWWEVAQFVSPGWALKTAKALLIEDNRHVRILHEDKMVWEDMPVRQKMDNLLEEMRKA